MCVTTLSQEGKHSVSQFKITLPEGLRSKLDQACAESGRSVAEEIRRRTEASFELDQYDDETAWALVQALLWSSRDLTAEAASPWHQSRIARLALAKTLAELIIGASREGEADALTGWDHHKLAASLMRRALDHIGKDAVRILKGGKR
jgi:hypothetical protein